MIVVVDYGLGNLGSILNMLKRVGAEAKVSREKIDIESAEKLILPGVGAFDNGMQNLAKFGLIDLLNSRVLKAGVKVIGLCLGLQLLTKKSEEGALAGLGWLDAETIRFKWADPAAPLKVPHMGWNIAAPEKPSNLFADMPADSRFYFAHSYHLKPASATDSLAVSDYGYKFVSAMEKDNIAGVQFHPEKSHKFGMQLLKNFVELF